MADLLEYRGYHGTVQYSAEDGLLVGSVFGIRDSLNYHGRSIDEITQAFHSCVDGYLEMCAALEREPDKEYKGSFNVRISPELHRKAALEAERQGISLNQCVQNALEYALEIKPVIVIHRESSQQLTLRSSRQPFPIDRYSSNPIGPALKSTWQGAM